MSEDSRPISSRRLHPAWQARRRPAEDQAAYGTRRAADRCATSEPRGFQLWPVVLVGRDHGHAARRNGRLTQSFVPRGPGLEFELEKISFIPFYRLGRGEPYQMYFDLLG